MERGAGGMSELSRHKVYQLLLPRVIDGKYGCFTFLLLHLHGLRIVYTVVKLINNQWKSWRWFEYQKTLQRSYIKHAAQCVTQYLSSRHLKVSLNNQYHASLFNLLLSVKVIGWDVCCDWWITSQCICNYRTKCIKVWASVDQHFEEFYFGRVSLLERTKLYTRWDDFSLLCYWLQC